MGAVVIEKHLTLDRNMPGPDHKASLEPDQFATMVHGIRTIERALGDGIKRPTPSEKTNLSVVRKSLCSLPIHSGELFSQDNLTVVVLVPVIRRCIGMFGLAARHFETLLRTS